jgi:hypothetical protein
LDDHRNNARESGVFEFKTKPNWRNLMRVASVASMAALATLVVGSASAMPVPAPYHGDPAITLASGGCGLAFHRTVYGGCAPNGYGYGAPVVVAPGFYGGGYGYHGGYYHGGGAYYHGGGYYHGGAYHGGVYHGYHGGVYRR